MSKNYFSVFPYLIIPLFILGGFKGFFPDSIGNSYFSRKVIQEEKKVLEGVLNELCTASGMYYSKNRRPTIEIKSGNFVAYFDPIDIEICVSEMLIEFALEQNMKKRTHIYLQVIGHELGHHIIALQKKRTESTSHLIESEEEEADILGIFIAMMAGHTTIKNDVPWILDSLYHRFKLNDNLKGYFPKKQRKRIAEYAIDRAAHLYKLFQFANYLTAAEKYAPAITIYDHLLGFYDSPEFYNNRGILKILQGIQENYYSGNKYQRFFFPIEFELESKLSLIRNDNKRLEEIDQYYFLNAASDFNSAISIDATNKRYVFNAVVAHILLRDYSRANTLLQEQCSSDGDMEQLLHAIIAASKGGRQNEETAIKTFQTLISRKERGMISQLANLNLLVLTGSHPQIPDTKPKCPEILDIEVKDLLTFNTIDTEFTVEKSQFQFGWDNNYFVFRENDIIRLSFQILPNSFPHNSIDDYSLSQKGLNFSNYTCWDSYGEIKIVHLGSGNGALMINYGL